MTNIEPNQSKVQTARQFQTLGPKAFTRPKKNGLSNQSSSNKLAKAGPALRA
jgi:hypothetical protein